MNDLNESSVRLQMKSPIESMLMTFNMSVLTHTEKHIMNSCEHIASINDLSASLHSIDDDDYVTILFEPANDAASDMSFFQTADRLFDLLVDYTPVISLN